MATSGVTEVVGDGDSQRANEEDIRIGGKSAAGGSVGGHFDTPNQHTSWDFVKIIEVPSDMKAPRLLCTAGANSVMLGDALQGAVYRINLNIAKMLKTDLEGDIMDCAMQSDGTLFASEHPSGCIGVYDSKGKRVREIRLIGVQSPCNLAIDVGKDGVLAAAIVSGGSNIVHLLNAEDGKLLRAGNVEAEEIKGEVRVTSSGSGCVIAKTGDDEFTVIDVDTARVRNMLKRAEWKGVRCAVDPVNDAIYVCYIREDKETNIAVIDEIDIGGRVLRKGWLEFRQISLPVIAPLVTRSGKMVVCNGKELLVYEKAYATVAKSAKKWVKV